MSIPISERVLKFEVEIPSTKKKVLCRPYLVSEEKILLMSKDIAGGNENEILSATRQILENCIVDLRGHKIEDLSMLDVEYLFLQLRMRSKGEIIEINYRGLQNSECQSCRKPKKVFINLNDIKILTNPEHTNNIKLTENIGVVMKYPKFGITKKLMGLNRNSDFETYYKLTKECLDYVYDNEDNIYKFDDYTDEEVEEFLNTRTVPEFDKLIEFFLTMPKLTYTIDLSCEECGRADVQVLEGLKSFFP